MNNWVKAKRIAESYGFKERDGESFNRVRKQIFAKLLTKGKTIGKNANTHKFHIEK